MEEFNLEEALTLAKAFPKELWKESSCEERGISEHTEYVAKNKYNFEAVLIEDIFYRSSTYHLRISFGGQVLGNHIQSNYSSSSQGREELSNFFNEVRDYLSE